MTTNKTMIIPNNMTIVNEVVVEVVSVMNDCGEKVSLTSVLWLVEGNKVGVTMD